MSNYRADDTLIESTHGKLISPEWSKTRQRKKISPKNPWWGSVTRLKEGINTFLATTRGLNNRLYDSRLWIFRWRCSPWKLATRFWTKNSKKILYAYQEHQEVKMKVDLPSFNDRMDAENFSDWKKKMSIFFIMLIPLTKRRQNWHPSNYVVEPWLGGTNYKTIVVFMVSNQLKVGPRCCDRWRNDSYQSTINKSSTTNTKIAIEVIVPSWTTLKNSIV